MDLYLKMPYERGSRFQAGIALIVFAGGLSGLLAKEFMVAYDPDAGIGQPVEEKMEFVERAYRIGRERSLK